MIYKTDNNVPISKFIANKNFKLKLNNFYQYEYNFSQKLYDVDYINFGVDGIIRDLFYIYRNKNIYYEIPNYKMVLVYSNEFNMKLTDIDNAEVVYLAYPNGALLKFPNINLEKLKNKIVIIDLSYYIYTDRCKDFNDFKKFIKYLKNLNYYVIYGPSKTLGLPGLRVGFCECNNPEIFKQIQQPWQITSISKFILDNLWNSETINKHVKIIKKSKKYFEEKYKDFIKFKTDGPFLALKNNFNELNTREFKDYKRLSVIDYKLLEGKK